MNSNDLRRMCAFCSLLIAALLFAGCRGNQKEKESNTKEGIADLAEGGIDLAPLMVGDTAVSRRFTKLESELTGIEFANELKPENMRKYLLNGAGLATGDFDGDGLVDLYAISQDGTNKLFRQRSPWKFEDVTESAGELGGGNFHGTGAAFVDIDNDSDLDLYVCNIDGPNFLFVNQGDGTFVELAAKRGIQFRGPTTMCSFADYDRDGDLDLYLVNNRAYSILEEQPNIKIRKINGKDTVHPDYVEQYFILDGKVQEAGSRDVLFQNDGNGNFVDVTEQVGIAGYDMGLSATWWDYDNDGWMDLYVANDLKSPDHLYRNKGNGTFQDVIADTVGHTPWFSMGADTADINNDGLMDFLVADMSSTTHYKQKTTMGEMGNSAWFLTTGRPRQFMRNALYINSGSDRMFEAALLTGLDSTDWSWSIKFADFDSDTNVDVFVTNGVGKNMNDSDAGTEYKELMKQGKKEEAQGQLLKMPPLKEENLAFRNLGDLKFENVASQWSVNHLGVSQGASVADIDRDGDLDLLVSNMNEPLGVYRNDIGDGNDLLVQLRSETSNRFGLNARVTVIAGDDRMVRRMNSARGFMSADEPVLHFGLGTHEQVDEVIVQWPSGTVQSFQDIQANQLVTITEGTIGKTLVPDETSTTSQPPAWMARAPKDNVFQHSHREMKYDDFRDQPLLPNKLSQLGPGIAWGDVDGDGLQDCYAGCAAGAAPKIYRQTKYGTFDVLQKFSDQRSYEDMGSVFLDADQDGDLDLYVVSGGYERKANSEYLQDRLYLNDGKGQFEVIAGMLPDHKASGSCVSAADFDRDGDVDLFVGTRLIPGQWPTPATSYLLENRNRKFENAAPGTADMLADIGLVTGATWTDVDQDGWIDLLVSLEWGPVKLFMNRQGKLQDATEAAGLAQVKGWWNSVTAGDIDNDGDMDFVAMNFGLNTKYHADDEHPVVLYAGDFDGSGTLDLVEAEYEGDTCYPVRGRSCSSHAMPFIKDKFSTYHEFALADVVDIYSEESLKESTKFTANELNSMVFLNDGKGHFQPTPLPRMAQISPAFGSVLEDFDGDGNLDLCIAQNFMNPQPETGQMDGGLSLMLKGDGEGNFQPMTPTRSGIKVAGQGMALAVVDLNRDATPDLMMSVNDEDSQLWMNQLVPDKDTSYSRCKVTLDAGPGNPTAIGALVLTKTVSGKKQARQVTAGGGYLSQSTPEIFLSSQHDDPLQEIMVRWPDGTEQTESFENALATPLILKIQKTSGEQPN